MNALVYQFKKWGYKSVSLYAIVALCVAASVFFVYHNDSFYDRPIAKVTQTNLVETTKTSDMYQNEDQLFTQNMIAQLKNGEEQGKLIYLTNEYSASGAYDHEYHVGNELFVSIDTNTEGSSHLTGTINDVKRDKYVLMVAWIFILTLLLVGKKQGLLSVISLVVNALLLSKALDIYLKTSGFSLLWICSISVILFTVISLLLVNGFNEKTYAAIVATLLGTLFSLVITYLVMVVHFRKRSSL